MSPEIQDSKPLIKIGDIVVYCAHDTLVETMKLVPHPDNPNRHSEVQIVLLAKIIKAQGFRRPITVSKRSGFIVAGEARWKAAQRLGLDRVPVDLQPYENEAAEYADVLADNKIAELAEIDYQTVSGILHKLPKDFDFDLTGFQDFEIEPLMVGEWKPPETGEMPDKDTKLHHITLNEEQYAILVSASAKYQRDNPSAEEISDPAMLMLLCNLYLNGPVPAEGS